MKAPTDTDVKVEEPGFLCNVHIPRLGSVLYYCFVINRLMLFLRLMVPVTGDLLCASLFVCWVRTDSSVLFVRMCCTTVITTRTCRLYQGCLLLIISWRFFPSRICLSDYSQFWSLQWKTSFMLWEMLICQHKFVKRRRKEMTKSKRKVL
jgi:hypothetical protein